jgi:hypothetical protein
LRAASGARIRVSMPMADTPRNHDTAAQEPAAAADTPRYRPRDAFWPYADLDEEPSDEELARLDPDLQAALFERPPDRPFSYTVVFGAFDGPDYPRAVLLARDSSDYLEVTRGDRLRHRARFTPDRAAAMRDLWQLVGRLDSSEVLIDDRPLPYARELWLPLLWHLLPH